MSHSSSPVARYSSAGRCRCRFICQRGLMKPNLNRWRNIAGVVAVHTAFLDGDTSCGEAARSASTREPAPPAWRSRSPMQCKKSRDPRVRQASTPRSRSSVASPDHGSLGSEQIAAPAAAPRRLLAVGKPHLSVSYARSRTTANACCLAINLTCPADAVVPRSA